MLCHHRRHLAADYFGFITATVGSILALTTWSGANAAWYIVSSVAFCIPLFRPTAHADPVIYDHLYSYEFIMICRHDSLQLLNWRRDFEPLRDS